MEKCVKVLVMYDYMYVMHAIPWNAPKHQSHTVINHWISETSIHNTQYTIQEVHPIHKQCNHVWIENITLECRVISAHPLPPELSHSIHQLQLLLLCTTSLSATVSNGLDALLCMCEEYLWHVWPFMGLEMQLC